MRSNMLMNCLWYEDITPGEAAEILSIEPGQLFRKIFDVEKFTDEEIKTIASRLNLTDEEVNTIFFDGEDERPAIVPAPVHVGSIDWIPVTDHQPTESGKYACWMNYGAFNILYYSAKKRRWNDFDDLPDEPISENTVHEKVTHWAFCPDGPDGQVDDSAPHPRPAEDPAQ